MKQLCWLAAGLAAVGFRIGAAGAQTTYASRGVVEVGGTAQLALSKQSIDVGGLSDSADTTTTSIDVQPLVGVFVAPRFQIFGGLLLGWESESPDEGEDETTTSLGALVGAGYYVPAGRIFVGPRATVGYVRTKQSAGDFDQTQSGPLAQLFGSLRVPFAWGGLLEAAAGLQYAKLGQESDGDAVGDTSELAIGAQLGFFIFF
jgi:hypothetical protein